MSDGCSEVHEQTLLSCDAIHRERRTLLKQEIGRMVLFFTDQPSLLAPNIQVNSLCKLSSVCYEIICRRLLIFLFCVVGHRLLLLFVLLLYFTEIILQSAKTFDLHFCFSRKIVVFFLGKSSARFTFFSSKLS